jgi:hypothetical protein
MKATVSGLLHGMESLIRAGTNVIPWSCPVPSFGDPSEATVATLGINPSNREFVDGVGRELAGDARRFHTLTSLRLKRWSDARDSDIDRITESCRRYFVRNPYDGWFGRLDQVVCGANASFYEDLAPMRACHLDLVPYATSCKWTELTSRQKSTLLDKAGDTFSVLLRNAPIRLLILNGVSVVEQFQGIAGVRLETEPMRSWTLRRRSRSGVTGVAYTGVIRTLCGVRMRHDITVVGFNHNLQSSFGVSTEVVAAIRRWIGRVVIRTLR